MDFIYQGMLSSLHIIIFHFSSSAPKIKSHSYLKTAGFASSW